MSVVGTVIHNVLLAFIFLLMVRFVVDWIQVFARSWTPKGPVLVALEVVFSITDPPIKFFRRLIPPLRLGGGMALDLSFLVVLILCYVLMAVNASGVLLAGGTGGATDRNRGYG